MAAKTTKGRNYWDVLWRAADGSWVPERVDAERFETKSVLPGLVEALRAQPRGPELGEVSGVLLADDREDPWPMPPRSVRKRPRARLADGQVLDG